MPEISARVGVSPATVYNIRHRYEAEGVRAALEERPRSGQPRKLNLEQEAQLTVLACSDAPVGHARWTIRLLADKVVELGIVEHIAPETVRQFLKKTNLSLGASSSGVSASPMEPSYRQDR
jgi:transposase